ncbi:hypothetical protein TNCV_2216271 [Trichonephila clavipes]|nr:hypothetical protein TNCV_2216271 [Trichonephila clavipes]
MSGAFLVITVFTELLRNRSGTPPEAVVRLAHQYLESYCCLFSFSNVSDDYRALTEVTASSSNNASVASPEEEKRRKDWVTVSLLVDRMAFWIFVLVYAILLIVLAAI